MAKSLFTSEAGHTYDEGRQGIHPDKPTEK